MLTSNSYSFLSTRFAKIKPEIFIIIYGSETLLIFQQYETLLKSKNGLKNIFKKDYFCYSDFWHSREMKETKSVFHTVHYCVHVIPWFLHITRHSHHLWTIPPLIRSSISTLGSTKGSILTTRSTSGILSYLGEHFFGLNL